MAYTIIMWVYYLISAGVLALLAWNFFREKKNRNDLLLTLLVMIPLVLRLLRIK